MFEKQPFYHNHIRNFIVAFGTLFSGITVRTWDKDGVLDRSVRVPIAYGPRSKWLERLRADPDLKNNVKTTFPRLAFEIVDYRYAPERKIGQQGDYLIGQRHNIKSGEKLGEAKVFTPAPWDVIIELSSIAKTQEDNLQILEQILPYFTPSLIINMDVLPEFNINKDIPITLDNIQTEDNYQTEMTEQRVVTQIFRFSAKLDFFGPMVDIGRIKHTLATIGTNADLPPEAPGEQHNAKVNPFAETDDRTDPHIIDEWWDDIL